MKKDNGAMSFTEGAIYETPTKENSFLDLSKLSEEEREEAIEFIEDYLFDYNESDGFNFLHFLVSEDMWFIDCDKPHKTEITFLQFKQIMGSEGKAEAEIMFTIEEMRSCWNQAIKKYLEPMTASGFTLFIEKLNS